jgi:alkylation response protein AidB-like acyl-CoA dehydrogenase
LNFAFTEEQLELREMARAFLAEHSGGEQIRAAMATEVGYDEKVWTQLAQELGWTAVAIPEAYGGLGLTSIELIALVEVMGESLLCAPFLSSICLASSAILETARDEQKETLLSGIAEATTRGALCVTERNGRVGPDGIEATVRREGADYVLSGAKHFVVDGHTASLLLIAARQGGSQGADGVSLFAVPAETGGVLSKAAPTMDATRRLASIELNEVRVGPDALLGQEGDAWPALDRAHQHAAVALAAEQVGGAQRCLDMAVEYSQEREQYGRPIGSFQALKHKMANMMIAVEAARSAVYYAACAAAERTENLCAVSSMAKAVATEAYLKCSGDALQIFGGVGFTSEYDIHLYFKRARSSASLLGDPAYHRGRVAQEIGL